jgi:hypothetical protein
VERSPALVLERTQEQRGDEAGAVLAVLDGLDHLVAILRQGLAKPDGVLRVRLLAVHEEGLLAQHVRDVVARQAQERLVGEDDGIAGQRWVGHRHGHAGGAHGLNEDPTLLPQPLDRGFSQRPRGRTELPDLEGVVGLF